MKGVIVMALRDLVTDKFGGEAWTKILKGAGIDRAPVLTPQADIDDGLVGEVLKSTCEVAGLTFAQAGEAFGDYWVNTFSQKMYGHYYTMHKNARSFLLAMDDVHTAMTKAMSNARPPRFRYEKKGDKTLIMHYDSKRGLIDIMIGLIHGVGRFYGEKLVVTRMGEDRAMIEFP